MTSILGILAATTSSLSMTFGFIIWDDSWKGSSYSLNLFKCTLATFIFLVVVFAIRVPKFSGFECSMLIVSSIIGIVIGDNAWLLSLQMIGARRVIIVDSIKPFLASLLGYFILDEPIRMTTLSGMVVSVIGILIVTLEKTKSNESSGPAKSNTNVVMTSPIHNSSTIDVDHEVEGSFTDDDEEIETESISSSSPCCCLSFQSLDYVLISGYAFAAINASLDAYGSVLTKQFGVSMNTWEINLIRFGFAAFSMSTFSAIRVVAELFRRGPTQNFTEIEFTQLPDSSDHDMGTGDLDTEAAPLTESEAKQKILNGENYIRDHHIARDREDYSVEESRRRKSQWYSLPYHEMSPMLWRNVTVGVVFVTCLCPALSNYALFQLDLGLCLTLTSLGPVFSLPLVYVMKGEVVSCRAIIGSVLAVVGIAIFFLT